MQLVECVARKCEFLKIRNLNRYSLSGRNIASFESKNIFAFRVEFSINSFSSLSNRSLVLSLCFLFLFDNSLDPCFSKACSEPIDADVGVDWKVVLNF